MKLQSSFLAISLAAVATTFAGHEVVSKAPIEVSSPFDKGRLELQAGGTYSHTLRTGESRPHVQDVGGLVRVGWMLSNVSGDGFFRGNCEFLLEGGASSVVEGPGNELASAVMLFRYNFVQPDSKWVPYFQLGAGGTYSDMHNDESQRLLGSAWSFNLQAGLGFRYLCSDRCAVFLEANYCHISNADTADRNIGINSIGGVVGVSLFY
jgi:hypothetical protein